MTTCAHKDSNDLAHMLLAALAGMEHVDPVLEDANVRLRNALLLWMASLRTRPLTSCYEFLTPPGSNPARAGWYWRHPKHEPKDWVNWHGPYTSRKAAVTARITQPGASRVPLDVIEADVFG